MACAPASVPAAVAAAAAAVAAPAAPVDPAARTARLAVAARRTCDAASPSVTSDSPLMSPAGQPRKPSSAAAFAVPVAAAGMLLLQSAVAAASPASLAAAPPPTQQTLSHTSPSTYSLHRAELEPDAADTLYFYSTHGPHTTAYSALAAAPSLVDVAEDGPLPQQQQQQLTYSTADSPYFSRQQPLGLEDGRIQACPSATNPNCISTSSFNESYAEPWEVPRASVATAPRKVESAILSTQKNAVIVASQPVDNGFLIIAEVDGLLGRDSIEVLIRTGYDYRREFDPSSNPPSPTSLPSPPEAGDGADDNAVVLYRCMSSRVVYVYPFTTPITEFGAQRKRMAAIGDELGWRTQAAACDFGVCSEFEDAEDEGTIRREPRILPLW